VLDTLNFCDVAESHGEIGVVDATSTIGLTRRRLLAGAGAAGLAGAALLSPGAASASDTDETAELVKQLTGRIPVESDRVHLIMPAVFANGYTVPLQFEIDSPMTDTDHVRNVRLLAPRNPIVEVATFRFSPQRSVPRASTRIRLAESQYVVALAEMNDDTLLMKKTWVEVATNGCA
jgi:sulfur-oxidizing protein SoxY